VKFDDLLAQYLYDNKQLQLQGIGSFQLDGSVRVHNENEKGVHYPIEGLGFVYNTKEITNEDLIAFLVKKLGKIQPLVRSDLDSYLSNIKQFLNIGKPYTIEGIGTLQKNNQGTYEFSPGSFVPTKEELSPKREKKERGEPSFNSAERSNSGSGGRVVAVILIAIASLAVLGGIGWGVYTLFFKKDKPAEVTTTVGTEELATDTTVSPLDTTSTQTLPAPVSTAAPGGDSARYRMVFEVTYSNKRAHVRTDFLRKSGINSMIDSGTINNVPRYRLYIPVVCPPADTLRLKDSLRKFFAKPIRVLAE
jgi:nucleoid DNA-binding protein